MPILKDNKKYCYAKEMSVRDYELDCEQIVNNANYLHYMEHTRHCFCRDAGLSFNEMHQNGIDPVVRKVEIEYHSSLRGGDKFISSLSIERKSARFIFHQDIINPNTNEIVTSALITIVCLKDGKLSRGEELVAAFGKYMK